MANECDARLKGLFNITATPFADDGSIDFARLAETIERMIAQKFDGLLIGGTYGEFPAMSPDDRAELFRRSIEFARNRVPVMLCSAASEPGLAKELTELASGLGGFPMVTAPYVSEVTEDQIFEFFRWIAPAAKRGLIIYNAPGIGITLSAELIERVSAIDSVIGLKQGDLAPTVIDQLANRLGGKLKLFCASDLAFLGPMMAGFDGLSSTNSSAFPELIQAAFRAVQAGDARTAIQLHQSWYSFRELARAYGQPQTVKAAMRCRGWSNGYVRPPLQPLTPKQTREVERVTKAVLATANNHAKQAVNA
jgi:4-hydroxy-tetrahydrodipicolinate synthase